MKNIFFLFILALVLSCGTKQGMIVADKERNQKDFNFSNYGSSIDITEQYKLDYHFSSTFAPNKMNVMWKQADVIDKRTNDTVRVEWKHCLCGILHLRFNLRLIKEILLEAH